MNIRINKTEVKIALLLIPLFTFAVGYKWPVMGMALSGIKYLVFLLCFLRLMLSSKIKTLFKDKSFRVLLCLFLVLAVSTVINEYKLANAFQLAMYGIYPYMIMALYMDKESGEKNILGGMNMAFTVLIILNLIIMVVIPEGLYSTFTAAEPTIYYLFGAKNQMVAPLLIGISIFIGHSYKTYNRLQVWPLVKCAICVLELAIGGSGTGIIILFAFVILFVRQQLTAKVMSPDLSYTVLGLAFIVIVVVQSLDAFSFFLEVVLHKSITLSNRTYIWDAAFESIKNNFIIGTGVSEILAGNVFLELDYISKNTFAHNMYLDYSVMGGGIAIILFAIFLITIKKCFAEIEDEKIYSFLWIGFWLYLVAGLVEIYIGNYYMFLIAAFISSKSRLKTSKVLYMKRNKLKC